MEIREPIDAEHRRLLRRAVVQHVGSLTGRAVTPALHVGTPGGTVRRFVVRDDERTDHALRADIVAAMLGRRREAPGRGCGSRAVGSSPCTTSTPTG